MSDTYVCPQCAAEYDVPGVCEACNVKLVAEDEKDELYGFSTSDEEDTKGDDDLGDNNEDKDIENMLSDVEIEEDEEAEENDSFEDEDNY